jgi:23S rRNA (uracil1939-C5)-methyltransferase
MSADEIIRIAAKGDGVTALGAHHAGTVTGDIVLADGTIERGPHYQTPPCQHFGKCGGCALQYSDDKALSDFALERVLYAAEGKGVEPQEILPTYLSPPKSRRRATLHGLRRGKSTVLGFRQAGSHKIIDFAECHVIAAELTALVPPLRKFIALHGDKAPVDIDLALTDQGADVSLLQFAMHGLEATEAALEFAAKNSLARLSVDMGYGPEAIWEPEPVTVTLGQAAVPYPSGAFLQATQDAEALMLQDAASMLAGAGKVADLFAGLGTFAFALAQQSQITAVEAARDAHLACVSEAKRAQLPITAMHRDLFRNPLQGAELGAFDAVLLDPPRAGARDQIAAIAASKLERVCYVSCNPASWSRDAKQLIEAGFTLQKVRPVGQFRWTTHVELVSYFTR